MEMRSVYGGLQRIQSLDIKSITISRLGGQVEEKSVTLTSPSFVSHASRCNFSIGGYSASNEKPLYKTIHIIKDGILVADSLTFEETDGTVSSLTLIGKPLFKDINMQEFIVSSMALYKQDLISSAELKVMRKVHRDYKEQLEEAEAEVEVSVAEAAIEDPATDENLATVEVPCVSYEYTGIQLPHVSSEEEIRERYPDLTSLKKAITEQTKNQRCIRFMLRGLIYSADSSPWKDILFPESIPMPRSKKKRLSESNFPSNDPQYTGIGIRRITWTDTVKL